MLGTGTNDGTKKVSERDKENGIMASKWVRRDKDVSGFDGMELRVLAAPVPMGDRLGRKESLHILM